MEPVTAACNRTRMALGAYVVGALDPVERAELDAHLANCRACRDDLSLLAALPAVLGRVGESDAVTAGAITVEPGMVERSLAELRRRRHSGRLRWRLVAVAAGVAIAAAGAGAGSAVALHLSAPATPSGNSARVSATDASSGAAATAVLLAEPWGTSIHLAISGVAPGDHCQLVAVSKSVHRGGRRHLGGQLQRRGGHRRGDQPGAGATLIAGYRHHLGHAPDQPGAARRSLAHRLLSPGRARRRLDRPSPAYALALWVAIWRCSSS